MSAAEIQEQLLEQGTNSRRIIARSYLAATSKQAVMEAPVSMFQQDFLAIFIFVDQTALSACCKVVVKQGDDCLSPGMIPALPKLFFSSALISSGSNWSL